VITLIAYRLSRVQGAGRIGVLSRFLRACFPDPPEQELFTVMVTFSLVEPTAGRRSCAAGLVGPARPISFILFCRPDWNCFRWQ
jgi:hypothetical protein